MAYTNRITGSNTEELIKSKQVNAIIPNESLNTRVLYFAQVIENEDPQNLNRIKCRIPHVDDDFYVGKKKDEGDAALPWCIPTSNRFLDVPEVNSIVMVAVFDTKVPHFGRMYFDSFSDLTATEYFERLSPEDKLLSNFDLIEDIFKIQLNSKPKTSGEYNAKAKINYKTGIRGKGKNKVLLDEKTVEIVQNFDEEDKLTSIKLTEDVDIHSSDIINIKSKKGRSTTYNPVFDDPLFSYLSDVNNTIKKIIMVLTSVPAISPAGPCTMGPSAGQLINELTTLAQKFQNFKKTGSSEKININ